MKDFDAFWPASHRDAEKMARLASAAHRVAGLDNISVPFDLTLEAEILGAKINYFEDKVRWPSAYEFVAKDPSDLKIPSDPAHAGRVPVVTAAIRRLRQEFEGKVPIFAYVNAPFTSISSYLVETQSFVIWVKTNPNKVDEFYKQTSSMYAEIAKAYREAGADVITFREEACSTSNLNPKQFASLVKPNLSRLIGRVGGIKVLHICGAADLIIEMMIECGAEAISIDENTPMRIARTRADAVKKGYPIAGNVPAYSVISNGSPHQIRESVKKSLDEGGDLAAPGCDFFLDTPTENLKAFVDACASYGRPPHWGQ